MKAIIIVLIASLLAGCSVTKKAFTRNKAKTEHSETDTTKQVSSEQRSQTDTSKNNSVVTLIDTTKTVTIDETITEYTITPKGDAVPKKTTTRKTRINIKGESSITSNTTIAGQSSSESKQTASQQGTSITDNTNTTLTTKDVKRTSFVWFGIVALALVAGWAFIKSKQVTITSLIRKLWSR